MHGSGLLLFPPGPPPACDLRGPQRPPSHVGCWHREQGFPSEERERTRQWKSGAVVCGPHACKTRVTPICRSPPQGLHEPGQGKPALGAVCLRQSPRPARLRGGERSAEGRPGRGAVAERFLHVGGPGPTQPPTQSVPSGGGGCPEFRLTQAGGLQRRVSEERTRLQCQG